MIINGTLTTVNIALLPVDNYSQSCITLAEAGAAVGYLLSLTSHCSELDRKVKFGFS